VKLALSIAGSDPTGGAGLQADLQVFRTLGLHGAGVVTALTVQDSGKVYRVLPVFPRVVLEQMQALFADMTPDVVKIGMLASDSVARHVARGLRDLGSTGRVPIVIDPVLAASDGTPLLETGAWSTLRELVSRATAVTPNATEAGALTGCDVSSEEGLEAAATCLVSGLGARAALVTGGDRDGPPQDLLAIRQGGGVTLHRFEGERIGHGPVHGTGCALSSALAAGLARGTPVLEAVQSARAFVADALRAAEAHGKHARFLSFGRQR
jgi:hydroxymethylpyrimidine/phosphomethylpyrimidine kinase